MSKQRTFTQLLLEQAKEQEAANVPRVDTPPQTKLERKKTARQRIIDALNGIGAQVDPNPRELKFVETKGKEMAELEKEIAELEKQIAELDQKIADSAAVMVPASQEVIQAAQEATKTDAIDAISEILPGIQESVGGELRAQVETVINEIEKVKSRESTPVSDNEFKDANDAKAKSKESTPVSDDEFKDANDEKAKSKVSTPVSDDEFKDAKIADTFDIQKMIKERSQIDTQKEYKDFKKSHPDIFKDKKTKHKKDKTDAKLEKIETAIDKANENSTNETDGALTNSLKLFEEIGDSKPIVAPTNSWIVGLQLFFTYLLSIFPESTAMSKYFSYIPSFLSFLVSFIATWTIKLLYFAGDGLWQIFRFIMWGLSGFLSSVEWMKHFNDLSQILSNVDCRDFWEKIGFNIDDEMGRIRNPVRIAFAIEEGKRIFQQLRGNGDDGDNGNIFQPHIQARFDAKPISPAKPKVAIRNSSFIPEDSNSKSGANGCKAIQSERTCESSELKCNWFKNRRPYQCKSSKVDKNREMVQAEITRLRQLTHDQIKKYVNNPDSAIYQDGWRRGPKKLMDKVLELKGTHGDSVQGSTHNTNKKGHRGGNKTRRKQNNKTRRKQKK